MLSLTCAPDEASSPQHSTSPVTISSSPLHAIVQDGSIAEAVVWQCGTSERHLIIDHVITYALKRHLGTACSVSGHAGLLDAATRQKGIHPDKQANARRLVWAWPWQLAVLNGDSYCTPCFSQECVCMNVCAEYALALFLVSLMRAGSLGRLSPT